GWTWDDLGEGYAAGVTELQFNENLVRATIAPGLAVGDEAIVTLAPVGSGLLVRNELKTVPEGTTRTLTVRRLPGSPQLVLSGSIPLSSAPTTHGVSGDNPTRFFVTVLRNTL